MSAPSVAACAADAGPPAGLVFGLVMAVLLLCLAPVWFPALCDYFGVVAKAKRRRQRDVNARAAIFIAAGMDEYAAVGRASRELTDEAYEVLS